MNKKKKCGFSNPLNLKKLNFEYVVVEVGKVKNVEYDDEGCPIIQPERSVILNSISGIDGGNRFCCTFYNDDAIKELREGEIISTDFRFCVKKDDNGNYVQSVTGQDVFTLNDFFQNREALAIYESRFTKDNQKAD